jgi:hypothetical protein
MDETDRNVSITQTRFRVIQNPRLSRFIYNKERNIMKRAYIKAFNKLAKLGCPVYEHYDDDGNFSISAEDAMSDTWLNYYDGDSYLENPEFGKSGRLCQILRDHGLFAEWVNPARASVYEI